MFQKNKAHSQGKEIIFLKYTFKVEKFKYYQIKMITDTSCLKQRNNRLYIFIFK